jgi:hypothetical protein
LGRFAGDGIGHVAKMHGSRMGERQHEADERHRCQFVIGVGTFLHVLGHHESEW